MAPLLVRLPGPGFAPHSPLALILPSRGANFFLHSAAGRADFLLFSAPRFALLNRFYWLCGYPGANRAAGRADFLLFSAPGFALLNRCYWLCGDPGANRAGARAGFLLFSVPRFALENRFHWLCGYPGANRIAARAAFSIEKTGTRGAHSHLPGSGPYLTYPYFSLLFFTLPYLFPFVFSDADNTE